MANNSLNVEERFIERATRYRLDCGELAVYESNMPSENIQFFFDQHVLTQMVAGHKRVLANGEKVEFFPGTLLIPEIDIVQSVSIPEATIYNPTMCLELKISPEFIVSYYNELLEGQESKSIFDNDQASTGQRHFMTNKPELIDLFIRLYKQRKKGDSQSIQLLCTLTVKQILIHLFQTQAIHLLLKNTEKAVNDEVIQTVIHHIDRHLGKPLKSKELAEVGGLGLTSFFNRFKKVMDCTPSDYILRKRIELAKSYIQKDKLSLKEIAFSCGFNSYEYFCLSFKKVAQESPSAFRKRALLTK